MSCIPSPREVLIAGSRLPGLVKAWRPPTRSHSLHLASRSHANEHRGPRVSVLALVGKNSIFIPLLYPSLLSCPNDALSSPPHPPHHLCLPQCSPSLAFSLQQQNTVESLGPSLHYFKKPIIRHQSIYVIRKSLPLQSRLSSLHTVITGTKSIFNHFTDWAHQLSRNIVSCLLCESNIWAKTITLLCSRAALKMPRCHFPLSWTLSFYLYPSPDAFSPKPFYFFFPLPFFFLRPALSSSLSVSLSLPALDLDMEDHI